MSMGTPTSSIIEIIDIGYSCHLYIYKKRVCPPFPMNDGKVIVLNFPWNFRMKWGVISLFHPERVIFTNSPKESISLLDHLREPIMFQTLYFCPSTHSQIPHFTLVFFSFPNALSCSGFGFILCDYPFYAFHVTFGSSGAQCYPYIYLWSWHIGPLPLCAPLNWPLLSVFLYRIPLI